MTGEKLLEFTPFYFFSYICRVIVHVAISRLLGNSNYNCLIMCTIVHFNLQT